MTKHVHESSNIMSFSMCRKCGAGATYQRECKICRKIFCKACQDKKMKGAI